MSFIEKYNNIPENIRNVFSSNEPRLAMESACFSYNVFEEDISKISQLVGDIFLKDVPLNRFQIAVRASLNISENVAYGIAYEITKKIFAPFPEYFTDVVILMEHWQAVKSAPIVSVEKVWKRMIEIEPWLLDAEREERLEQKKEIENTVKVETISIIDALEKYPKIELQNLSLSPIKLQNYPEPARPSVRNWIKSFQESMGAMKHSPIDRGNFLFHSENAKNLTATERQKVALILKSLDEQTLLTIDPGLQVVVFAAAEAQVEKREVVNPVKMSTPPIVINPVNSNSAFPIRTELKIEQKFNNDTVNIVSEKISPTNFWATAPTSATSPAPAPTMPARQMSESVKPESKKVEELFQEHDYAPKFAAPISRVNLASSIVPVKKIEPVPLTFVSTQSNTLGQRSISSLGSEKVSSIANEESENYFSIPSSKRPIGSSEYNLSASMKETVIPAKTVNNSPIRLDKSFHLKDNVPSLHSGKQEAAPKEKVAISATVPVGHSVVQDKPVVKIVEKTPATPLNHAVVNRLVATHVAPSKKIVAAPVVVQADPNSMSDEDLLRMYQAKKVTNVGAKAKVSRQNVGSVSFSSPQKFSAEGSGGVATQQPASLAGAGAYRTAPVGFSEDSEKKQKNVVDLRI
jgi:hypothetical protein